MILDFIRSTVASMFKPPPMPPIDLGWAGRLSGAEDLVRESFAVAYWAGVRDGSTFGALACLALAVVVLLLRTTRKGTP
jgi:hypothetical protein